MYRNPRYPDCFCMECEQQRNRHNHICLKKPHSGDCLDGQKSVPPGILKILDLFPPGFWSKIFNLFNPK